LSEEALVAQIARLASELSSLPFSRSNFERRLALNQEKEAAERQLAAIRKASALSEEIRQVRAELAGLPADTPKVERARLERQLAALEVEASATG
jgi:hypothetical protein